MPAIQQACPCFCGKSFLRYNIPYCHLVASRVDTLETDLGTNFLLLLKSSVTAQKRACNTATCVTHRLADFLSRSGGVGKNNFVPTNVGSKAFGRRRRNVQI